MRQPRSATLFHFTKSLDVLQCILRDSFIPRFCLEDVSWLGLGEDSCFAYPIVSFCDIPLGRIADHVDFFGHYGLGLSREWAIRSGLNPILYVSKSSALGTSFLTAVRAAIETDKEKDKSKHAVPHLKLLMAHMKPLSGMSYVGNQPFLKDFYLENEWRYLPSLHGLPTAIVNKHYEDPTHLEPLNQRLKDEARLVFSPDDIRYIFVRTDSDIPFLVDFMYSCLGHISVSDMKILLTRVTSLQHIEQDI